MSPAGPGPVGGARITYLDNAATAPLRPEATDAMAPFSAGRFANPSGAHRLARDARQAREEARDEVAAFTGSDPKAVVFTSGGTESDNLAIIGSLAALPARAAPPVVVCSAIEHDAVLETCRAAAAGRTAAPAVELRLAPVDALGVLDLDALAGLLDERVALISVMAANNEVGAIQPLGAVAALARELSPEALLHTDAVQAAAFFDLAPLLEGYDLVTVSAHKLGGPKGAGALVARGVPLVPLAFGGGQEQERRSGTQGVAGAVGMAAAMAAARASRPSEGSRVARLRDTLRDGLLGAVPDTIATSLGAPTLPGHCHVRFPGIEQEELLVLLDDAGVCASAGSACASGALEASHVLLAMGVDERDARTGVRFSLGWASDEADVAHALAAVAPAVARLRGAA